jgi:hypothetical protein
MDGAASQIPPVPDVLRAAKAWDRNAVEPVMYTMLAAFACVRVPMAKRAAANTDFFIVLVLSVVWIVAVSISFIVIALILLNSVLTAPEPRPIHEEERTKSSQNGETAGLWCWRKAQH